MLYLVWKENDSRNKILKEKSADSWIERHSNKWIMATASGGVTICNQS